QVEERTLNELRLVVYARLLFHEGIVLHEILSDGWRPQSQIACKQSRTPTAPVQRLATDAVRLTDKWHVTAPSHAPNQISRDARIVGRDKRVGHVETNIRKILKMGGDEKWSGIQNQNLEIVGCPKAVDFFGAVRAEHPSSDDNCVKLPRASSRRLVPRITNEPAQYIQPKRRTLHIRWRKNCLARSYQSVEWPGVEFPFVQIDSRPLWCTKEVLGKNIFQRRRSGFPGSFF